MPTVCYAEGAATKQLAAAASALGELVQAACGHDSFAAFLEHVGYVLVPWTGTLVACIHWTRCATIRSDCDRCGCMHRSGSPADGQECGVGGTGKLEAATHAYHTLLEWFDAMSSQTSASVPGGLRHDVRGTLAEPVAPGTSRKLLRFKLLEMVRLAACVLRLATCGHAVDPHTRAHDALGALDLPGAATWAHSRTYHAQLANALTHRVTLLPGCGCNFGA